MFDGLGTRATCAGEGRVLQMVVGRCRGDSWVGRIAYVVDSSRRFYIVLFVDGWCKDPSIPSAASFRPQLISQISSQSSNRLPCNRPFSQCRGPSYHTSSYPQINSPSSIYNIQPAQSNAIADQSQDSLNNERPRLCLQSNPS